MDEKQAKVSGNENHKTPVPKHPDPTHPKHYYPGKRTLGQQAADGIASFGGSWTFIIIFLFFLVAWMAINEHMLQAEAFDPYPFILLNLVLSCLAAIQAPIILMSQNRAAERDRTKVERDYYVNRKAEHEITDMQADLEEIKKLIKNIKRETHEIKKKGDEPAAV